MVVRSEPPFRGRQLRYDTSLRDVCFSQIRIRINNFLLSGVSLQCSLICNLAFSTRLSPLGYQLALMIGYNTIMVYLIQVEPQLHKSKGEKSKDHPAK
jgi:hypothetical protein